MPKRRRIKEAQRRAARALKRPDLRACDVEVVGKTLQEEEAWLAREGDPYDE